jgi:hypothetical protein
MVEVLMMNWITLDAAKRVNQLCEELGIPQKNSEQYQVI